MFSVCLGLLTVCHYYGLEKKMPNVTVEDSHQFQVHISSLYAIPHERNEEEVIL